MKLDLRTGTALFATALLLIFASTSFAQKVGGYKEISRSDAGARSAAVFAVGAQAAKNNSTVELGSVLKAESQVVAGMNYRLCLKVTTSGAAGEADVISTVKVVVYRDLKGNYKLTSWIEEECGDDDDDDGN